MDPGEPHNVNFYDMTLDEIKDQGIGILPQNLSEAITALGNDAMFAEALGEGIIKEFTELKRAEWAEYHRHVSDWEVSRYLNYF
jgi:glutamine synthetase